ncbi:PREDICTED: LRR receptor-like serine/threonine-protein kinase FLS2 [Ipomoea nil]|uniref:LRR receptor-like serine/threonine-protein kinase FLS2 n=1 Tax=Ipomoea nil TaxID=35883 RepID=UPI000900E9F2|nr:PREDICTED: LRR receptor-like serine/threonine-protein kinase FLS2 [Ipomoea nil]
MLQIVWLNNQEVGGMTSPIDVIGSMVGLVSMWLPGNRFSGSIPSNIDNLTSLKDLNLNENQLVGLILQELPSLTALKLSGNGLSGTKPKNFHNSMLQIVWLNNQEVGGMTSPIDVIGSIVGLKSSQLTNFSCSKCNIVRPLPGYFGELPSLSALKLSGNGLSGTIPNNFHNSMLQILWLNNQEGSGMTSPIDVIGSMVGLVSLWLHGNRFSGSILANIKNLPSLNDLSLNVNQLVGMIPQGLANLDLYSLNLDSNMLMACLACLPVTGWVGKIPTRKSSQLTIFSCSNCNIVGPLPRYFGELPSLTALNCMAMGLVEGGGMTSPIDVIGSMVGLVSLWIHGNRFSGSIPGSIENLTSLKDLSLNENQLVGLIPQGLANLDL